MTEIDRTKEWTFNGRRLGYRQHVSPYNGGISWATVDLDTNEVLALESSHPYEPGEYLAGASCTPHQLVVPEGMAAEFAEKIECISTGAGGNAGPTRNHGGAGEDASALVRYTDVTPVGVTTETRIQVLRRIALENAGLIAPGAPLPPYALTDEHVAELERAIRAEGYDILVDTDTGKVRLTGGYRQPTIEGKPIDAFALHAALAKILAGAIAAQGVESLVAPHPEANGALSWCEVEEICMGALGT